jgi:hypothetical protein
LVVSTWKETRENVPGSITIFAGSSQLTTTSRRTMVRATSSLPPVARATG